MISSRHAEDATSFDQGVLADTLGHSFKNPALLRRALTHASTTGRGSTADYERLEFLGDRVLGLLVADMLLRRFPDATEGELAKRHAWLVSREALAEVAEGLGLGAHLIVAKGTASNDLQNNPAVLADACEAVIAALYLDGGLEAARGLIGTQWAPLIELARTPPREPKTTLQEWVQARGMALPSYRVVEQEGPDHEPLFTIEAAVPGSGAVTGKGRSKRAAEQEAAAKLLELLARGDSTS